MIGYDVLIRTADGRTFDSSFEDDDFNVYPHHNATAYPGEGDEFTVRYLQRLPADFIILGEDDSPGHMAYDAEDLLGCTHQPKANPDLRPMFASYRKAVVEATGAETSAGCD